MKALILAAGSGLRMKNFIGLKPKGFMKFGNIPIIEESINNLIENGINDITIVTGYQSKYYEELILKYKNVKTIHNDKYANSGSMYSLYLAKDKVKSDFLLLESDIIYEKRAIKVLLNDKRENLILISGPTNSHDEVYVDASIDRIVNISKKLPEIKNNAGELVGISKFNNKFYDLMCKFAEKDFKVTLNIEYDSVTIPKAANELPVYFHKINDLVWSEIDDENHFNRAKNEIYPKILELNKKR